MPRLSSFWILLLPGALACGANPAPAPGGAETAHVQAPATVPQPEPRPGRAHRLVVAATGCWFGGVWRDALNETNGGLDRCSLVLEGAYGQVDKVRLERLRAVESVEVDELAGQVARIARTDATDAGRADALVALLKAIAAAEHETTAARRAGDRIKKDIAGTREPGKRPEDERASVAPLTHSEAIAALLGADGPLGAEARAVALLCAADRMQTAKDLPKHVKVYAVGGAYELVFGVKVPQVPDDATQPMQGGLWLGYLSDVARAAGHPVPARAATLLDRELMAWGGALQGFSDRLRVEAAAISEETEMRRMVLATVERLDTEYRASEASVLAKGS